MNRAPGSSRRNASASLVARSDSAERTVAIDRQELPGAGHATQLDAAAVLEPRARADHQVTHGAGDQDFAGAGLPQDPRRNVYRQPPDVGVFLPAQMKLVPWAITRLFGAKGGFYRLQTHAEVLFRWF